MEIPGDHFELTLRQGSVFFMQHRGLTSPLPHFMIVINPDPRCSDSIVLGVVTSKVEKCKARAKMLKAKAETLVEIGPEDYSELSKHSIVDCNDPKLIRKQELKEKKERREIMDKAPVSDEIAMKLLQGVLQSHLVKEEIKDLLRNRQENWKRREL